MFFGLSRECEILNSGGLGTFLQGGSSDQDFLTKGSKWSGFKDSGGLWILPGKMTKRCSSVFRENELSKKIQSGAIRFGICALHYRITDPGR